MAGRKKGTPKTGGRKKGSLNKLTKTQAEAREALENALFGRFEGIGDVLSDIQEDDKAKYIDALNKLLQYIMPKKQDITSKDNAINPLTIVIDKDSGNI